MEDEKLSITNRENGLRKKETDGGMTKMKWCEQIEYISRKEYRLATNNTDYINKLNTNFNCLRQ